SAISVRTERGTARLLLSTPEVAGSRLGSLTGSRAHVDLLRKRADALHVPFGPDAPAATGDEGSRALQLPLLPAHTPEVAVEIDVAERGALPPLVVVSNIRGDLHMHSTWSDGRDSIEGMIAASRQLGYEYVAITDHSEHAGASRTLATNAVHKQRQEVE